MLSLWSSLINWSIPFVSIGWLNRHDHFEHCLNCLSFHLKVIYCAVQSFIVNLHSSWVEWNWIWSDQDWIESNQMDQRRVFARNWASSHEPHNSCCTRLSLISLHLTELLYYYFLFLILSFFLSRKKCLPFFMYSILLFISYCKY